MKRAVVTGANGFVGSHIVKELIANGIFVIAVHRKGREENIPDSSFIRRIELDMADIEDLITAEVSADVFFHLAWDGTAGESRADVKCQLENVLTTCSCVKTAKAIGCKRFIYSSSIIEDEVFSACSSQGLKPGIGYIYGSVKQTANHIAKMTAAKCGIEYLAGKISNTYGVGELSPRLINTTLRRIIMGEAVKFTEGTQNYDFIYISDAARAFRLIAQYGKPFHEYFIGSGNPKLLCDFLLEMRDAVAPEYEFIFGAVPFTGVNIAIENFDVSLIREHCGFMPNVSFIDGIKLVYEWLKNVPPQRVPYYEANLRASENNIQKFSAENTGMDGLLLVKPYIAKDSRGEFVKDYSLDLFEQNGIDVTLKEVFYSESKAGVIRGLHFQHTKWQTKLVRCIKGKIYDVVVDIRENSLTFGQWKSFILSENNYKSLLIPEGFAHGFFALEQSIVSYKCDEKFYAEFDDGIIWNDPDISIDWPIGSTEEIILSDKDKNLQTFKQFKKNMVLYKVL